MILDLSRGWQMHSPITVRGKELRAVLSGESVIERSAGVHQEAERQRAGGGGGQHDQADHHGLDATPGQAPAGRAEGGGIHCRAPAATWPTVTTTLCCSVV